MGTDSRCARPDPATVLLVRHPETDWNHERRYQGCTDRPLTGRGAASVPAIVDWLSPCSPVIVATSPAAHARALAAALTDAFEKTAAPVVDPAWREIDHGDWEGLRHDEVVDRFGERAQARFADPLHNRTHGGETLAEVIRRVKRAWASLIEGGGGTMVVVTHATPVRVVLCHCLGLSPAVQWRLRIDNSSVTRVDVSDGSPMIAYMNRVAVT